MNKKGMFTTAFAVAAIAVVFLAATIVHMKSFEDISELKQTELVRTKTVWQNVRYLLDKAVADVTFDFVVGLAEGGTCEFPGGFEEEIKKRFDDILSVVDRDLGVECQFLDLSSEEPTEPIINILGNTVNASYTILSCSKSSAGTTTNYSALLEIEKGVNTTLIPNSEGPDSCHIEIIDSQGDFVEMEVTISLG